MSIATSFAPPCFGPRSAPIAPVMHEIHVRAGAGDHARGEGRGVELVLGVQDQRLVERIGVQLRSAARRAAGAGSARRRCRRRSRTSMRRPLRVKCHQYSSIEPKLAISRSAMSRASRRRMAFALRQHGAEHRAAGAHHVHRVRVGGHQLQRFLHDRRQAAQALELGLVGLQLRRRSAARRAPAGARLPRRSTCVARSWMS